MRNGLVALVAGACVALAGCGGSGTAGATTAAATQAPAAATSGPTDAGASGASQPAPEASVATPAPEASATGGGGGSAGGGGGTAAGVCELVTPDELAGIFNVASVTTEVLAGPPDNCIVSSGSGDGLTAWSLTTAQSGALYDAFTVDPTTVQVPGIGDKAAIVQNTGLMVLKGASLLVISISGGTDMSEEEGIEAAKQIGSIAVGRL